MVAEGMRVLGCTAGKGARDVAFSVPGEWREPGVAGAGDDGEDGGVSGMVGGLLRA